MKRPAPEISLCATALMFAGLATAAAAVAPAVPRAGVAAGASSRAAAGQAHVVAAAPSSAAGALQDEALRARVRAALEEVPLIDGHNDVPWQYLERVDDDLDAIDLEGDTSELDPPMHTDFRRLRQGLVGGVFWSVYLSVDQAGPGAVRDLLRQIDVVHQLVRRYPQELELALTADDVVRIHAEGRIASLIGMEGGHSIDNSLAVLRIRRPLHDPDTRREHRLGGLRHRHPGVRRPHRFRPRSGA